MYLNSYQDHLQRIAEYDDLVVRLQNVDATLAQIETDIENISGGSGTLSGVVLINNTQLVAPLTLNSPDIDLIYLLGASDLGYGNVSPAIANLTASTTELFTPSNITNRGGDTRWYSNNIANQHLTLDFATNKASRAANITSIGFRSYSGGGLGSPINLIILGSVNGSSYTTITNWNGIGFTADNQWKYITFTNPDSYRFIRITQSGVNDAGNNYFSCKGLKLYGTIDNP